MQHNTREGVLTERPSWLPLGFILALILITGVVAFTAGYFVALLRTADRDDVLRVFWEAHELVNRQFYYKDIQPSQAEQMNGAIKGMLATFKDPHSVFLPLADAQREMALMQGETGGVGAVVGLDKDNRVVVTEVRLGWPAEQAGVKIGDVILAVNGTPLDGKTLNDAVSQIRGPLGSSVTITVKRPGIDDLLELTMLRQQINVYGTLLDGNIAYISMSIFSSDGDRLIKAELERLLKYKPRALIFDLRNNPGGFLDQAVKVADIFLSEGRIASEKTTEGDNTEWDAKPGDAGEQIPMVVLVNGGSASASEIVAGALKDRERATLIGTRTFGKGSVQAISELSDGSQLRVTHGAWYTPNETPITVDGQPVGLTPNIEVKLPEAPESLQPGVDPYRDAAVTYINSSVLFR